MQLYHCFHLVGSTCRGSKSKLVVSSSVPAKWPVACIAVPSGCRRQEFSMIQQPICLCLNLKHGEPGPPLADHDHQVVRSAVFCLRFSWHKDRSKNAVSNTSSCECELSARRGKVKPTMAFTKIGRQATASVPQLLLETATPYCRAAAHACSKVC